MSLEGVGISIRWTDQVYRYKSDHLDTASWDLGLIFPKSSIPSQVVGMEFATHDFRPASEDSRTDDRIDRIKADAAGNLLIAMPSSAASGNGWVRLNSGTAPDYYLDRVGRYTEAAPDTNSPYWFYKRTYTTPGVWVLLPVNSITTNHPPFVFAAKGELYWENPPILPGAVTIAVKSEGGLATSVANPKLLILSNGDYLASIGNAAGTTGISLWRSVDKGLTWSLVEDGFYLNRDSLFEHQGSIYEIGWNTNGEGTRIYKSSNNGASWTTSVFWGVAGGDAPSHVDVVNGRIWKAATVDITGGTAPGFLSIPIGSNLMSDSNWIRSAPGATWGATYAMYSLANGQKAEITSEGEGTLLTTKEGRLVNATKSTIYRPADGLWKDGIAMVYADPNDINKTAIDPDYVGPRLPGASAKYTVRYDPVSDRYWALTSGGINRGELNLYSASSAGGKIGDFQFESRILEGHSTSYHGFNYPFMQFDGDDIVFTLRTAWDHHRGTSDRWHDADLFTFHRIKNFRNRQKITAHWKLDETAVSDQGGFYGPVYENTGLQPDGAIWNYTAGMVNHEGPSGGTDRAYDFAMDSSLSGVETNTTDVIPEADDFSLLIWFKTNNPHTTQGHLFSNNNSQAGRANLYVGSRQVTWWVSGGPSITAPGFVDDNQWHRVIVTRHKDLWNLYLDDQPAQSQTISAAIDPYTPWMIGRAYRYLFDFEGLIGDVRVYNYAVDQMPDFNCDKVVNLKDFAVLAAQWIEHDCDACLGADLSLDGQVNVDDVFFFVNDWLLSE